MNNRSMALIGMVFALYGCAAAETPQTNAERAGQDAPAVSKSALQSYLQHMWGPNVTISVGDPRPSSISGLFEVDVQAKQGQEQHKETLFVSQDGQKIIRGNVLDINRNPFESTAAALKTNTAPGFGPENAPVTVVVFSDYQCPYCRQEAQLVRNELPKAFPEQVRVFFKDYPLDQIHNWARLAAIGGRCVYRQNKAAFWDFHDWIFARQSEIQPDNVKAKILEFANGRNLDSLAIGRCLDTRATENEVNASIAEGRALNVDRTPYLFINGRRVIGMPWEQIRGVVARELEFQKKAAANCCQVTLPFASK